MLCPDTALHLARAAATPLAVQGARQPGASAPDFEASSLALGSVPEWAVSARLTVTVFDPHSRLRLAYHNPKWDWQVDGIAYDFELQEGDDLVCGPGWCPF